jgi:hypothetical protein
MLIMQEHLETAFLRFFISKKFPSFCMIFGRVWAEKLKLSFMSVLSYSKPHKADKWITM